MKSIAKKMNGTIIFGIIVLSFLLLLSSVYAVLGIRALGRGNQYSTILKEVNGTISVLHDMEGLSSAEETLYYKKTLNIQYERLKNHHRTSAPLFRQKELPSCPEFPLSPAMIDEAIGELGSFARGMGSVYRQERDFLFYVSLGVSGGSFLLALFLTGAALYLRRFNVRFYRYIGAGISRLKDVLSYDEPSDNLMPPRWDEEARYGEMVRAIEKSVHAQREMGEDFTSMTLEEFLPKLEASLSPLLDFDRLALAFIDRLDNVIAESALIYTDRIVLEPGFVCAMSDTSLGMVAATGEGRIINDLVHHYEEIHKSPATRMILDEGIRSSITLPLMFRHNCIGFLFLSSQKKNAYTKEELHSAHRVVQIYKQNLYYQYLLQQVLAESSEAFVQLMEKKDNETSLHILRMARYSHIIAKAYNMMFSGEINPRFLREILWFAPLHDIGKIGIPDNILLKPGKLTPEEFEVMKGHVVMGETVLQGMSRGMNRILDMSLLNTAIDIAGSHHEKYDGSGYPRHLHGEDIPLAGRIVAAADVFDALTTKRPYKEAWPVEKALSLLRRERGTHFCPKVIDALEESLPAIMDIYEKYREV